MQLLQRIVCMVLVYSVAFSCANSIYSDERRLLKQQKQVDQTPSPPSPPAVLSQPGEKDPQKMKEIPENDVLAMARHRATQVVIEKILIALGPEVLQEKHGAPNNETHPTVASPLNITTDPCPEIYMKCSSEIFLSSCDPPKNADADLWNRRRNLYFELPDDLLASDQLLNATLRIFKNNSLPVRPSSTLIVELYVYKKSLTKVSDVNFLYDSKVVLNDYIGWITFDITDLIHKMDLKDHHGYFIKVKQADGLYWNDPTLIVPMDCSGGNKIVPVPFGVKTDQPEQKFPSLTIHTGMLEHYFYNLEPNENDVGEENETLGEKEKYLVEHVKDTVEKVENGNFMEEINPYHKNHEAYNKRQYNHNIKKMSGDDPRVFDDIYNYGDEESTDWHPEINILEERGGTETSEEVVPVRPVSSLNKNLRQLRHSKVFRQPVVANQVYNEPSSIHSLDNSSPPELPLSLSEPLSQEWRNTKKWSSLDPYKGNQREVKKRLRSKRRHQNHHHQRDSYLQRSHFPHSRPLLHFPSLRPQPNSHLTHIDHETQEYSNKRAVDTSLQTDS